MPVTLKAWQEAIISAISTQAAARGLTLATCEERDPRTLRDDAGHAAIDTPAVILERGPMQILVHDAGMAGRCYRATEYEWRAYCVSRVDATDYLIEPDKIANLVRATVFDAGATWGLGVAAGEMTDPEWPEQGREVDLGIPGYACRMLSWVQGARLVDDYS